MTDPVLAEMREVGTSFDGRLTIERVVFGPAPYAIRITQGRKKIGPLLFPAEGQTIGQCLDLFLKED